jgi:vacuolar iron transporter family protein
VRPVRDPIERPAMNSMTKPVESKSILQAVSQSFMSSLGSIVFGMEDGAVSIFGLVFGVAASAANSQTVLLAGATGAISAAVSMMAGTYLDVSTERDQAQSEIAEVKKEIERKPVQAAQEVRDRLLRAGFTHADTETVLTIVQRTPGAMLKDETAFKLQIGMSADRNPWVQSIWMFVTDLFAAFVPVLPFAFLPLGRARTLSLVVTAILLLVLGIGRGIIGHKNMVVTALQTSAIAAAAGVAGLLVGSLITGRLGGQ